MSDPKISVKPQRRQIFIGNLSYNANEQSVRDAFKTLGVVLDAVRIVTDQDTGRPKGFAFADVSPDESSSVREIINLTNGLLIEGRACRVNEAKPRPQPGAGDVGDRGAAPSGQAPREPRAPRGRRSPDDDDFEWRK